MRTQSPRLLPGTHTLALAVSWELQVALPVLLTHPLSVECPYPFLGFDSLLEPLQGLWEPPGFSSLLWRVLWMKRCSGRGVGRVPLCLPQVSPFSNFPMFSYLEAPSPVLWDFVEAPLYVAGNRSGGETQQRLAASAVFPASLCSIPSSRAQGRTLLESGEPEDLLLDKEGRTENFFMANSKKRKMRED